ncbi:MAG: VWA domain-containing protein [Kofleriaceae bacterium]|nr:VWA domain-containing protein [Kofleriaceae bacterium]
MVQRSAWVTAALGAAMLPAVVSSNGCSASDETRVETTVQEIRTGRGGMVGLDVLVTDNNGDAIPCGVGTLSVQVEAARGGGAFTTVDSRDVLTSCAGNGASVAMVVDNSGSQTGHLNQLRTATTAMVDGVLDAGGQAAFVRVSTNATRVTGLTENREALHNAIAAMHVNRGWTALFDGIRMANETLGGAIIDATAATPASHVGAFCAASRKTGIIVFTDGRENNSADEHSPEYDRVTYPGDGFATTFDDIHKLRIDGVTTPIYTIGLGRDIDEAGLTELANATGGRYLHTDSAPELPTLFDRVRQYLGASHQVCVDLPLDECGDVELRVNYDWTDGVRVVKKQVLETVHLACPQAPRGKVATMLLTVSNPGISRALADNLVRQAVDYVAPAAVAPRILVVRDDGHHNEAKEDPRYVEQLLRDRGYPVTFIEEPRGGLRPSDVAGYQLVWFSNPGYPIDDQRSFETLLAYSAAGGGVVLQGDDMTQAMGRSFSMTPLTRLTHVNNGTSACGVTTDNNRGGSYSVQFAAGPHPLLGPLANQHFNYGDDLDVALPANASAEVLGSATFARGTCRVTTPVLVAFDASH